MVDTRIVDVLIEANHEDVAERKGESDVLLAARTIAGQGVAVEKGVFGEYMQVSSINDGPVTFLLDSSRLF